MIKKRFMFVDKLDDFLYYADIQHKEIDYEFAIKYFYDISFYKNNDKQKTEASIGGCTAIRNGNLFGRNLDWRYDNSDIYVMRTYGNGDKYSSIGVGGDVAKLVDMQDGYSEEKFNKLLPFLLLDGINEKGLSICINYNPNDFGKTYGTNEGKEGNWISLQMFTRYVLDNFASVKELVKWLKTEGKVYGRFNDDGTNQEYHFLVADSEDTYVIDFVNNEAKAVDVRDKPYLTNFHIYDTQFEKDGKIEYKNVSDCANGVERYNIVVDNYDITSTEKGMIDILTKCYCSNMSKEETKPIWYSDFMYFDNSLDINTLLTNRERYTPIIENAYKDFKTRDRNKHNTFHTLYSCVYNIENRSLNLITQEENNKQQTFTL